MCGMVAVGSCSWYAHCLSGGRVFLKQVGAMPKAPGTTSAPELGSYLPALDALWIKRSHRLDELWLNIQSPTISPVDLPGFSFLPGARRGCLDISGSLPTITIDVKDRY